jgi:hypothetical protein
MNQASLKKKLQVMGQGDRQVLHTKTSYRKNGSYLVNAIFRCLNLSNFMWPQPLLAVAPHAVVVETCASCANRIGDLLGECCNLAQIYTSFFPRLA